MLFVLLLIFPQTYDKSTTAIVFQSFCFTLFPHSLFIISSRSPSSDGLDQLEPPKALPVHDEVVVVDLGAPVDAQGLAVALHQRLDVAALEFDVADLVQRPGARRVVIAEALAFDTQRLLEALNSQRHISTLVVDLCE